MAYYTVRYSYTIVRTRLEFSETDLRTVSGYDQFTVNSSQVELLLTVRTNILVKHHVQNNMGLQNKGTCNERLFCYTKGYRALNIIIIFISI